MTTLPGPILYLIYSKIVQSDRQLSLTLFSVKSDLAVILSTFSFTMLGFLAAVITILFSFSNSRNFKKYKGLGHLDIFFSVYYWTVLCLVITFACSILTLSDSGVWVMRAALMSTVNNVVQISLLTFIIISISKKSIN